MSDELKEAFQQLIIMNENFLRLQKDFVIAINDLSNRLSTMDLKDNQCGKNIEDILDYCTDICRKMEVHPNQDIITELRSVKTLVDEAFNKYKLDRKDSNISTKTMLEQVATLVKNRRWIDRVIWIAVTLLTLAAGVFNAWKIHHSQNDVLNKIKPPSSVIVQQDQEQEKQ